MARSLIGPLLAIDIEEALQVSCDLSCACLTEIGLATLGKNLPSFTDYDEQQGREYEQNILRMQMSREK